MIVDSNIKFTFFKNKNVKKIMTIKKSMIILYQFVMKKKKCDPHKVVIVFGIEEFLWFFSRPVCS